jgi:hypothetical protein
MILPASAQILLHSSVLIWTAYYLMFKPFVILDSTLVVIFGHALHLVFILITAVCLILAAVLSNPFLGPWSHIFWSTIAVSRHCRYNSSFSKRLDLLSCHEYYPRDFPTRDVRLMTSAVTRFYDVCTDGLDVSGFETEYCQ